MKKLNKKLSLKTQTVARLDALNLVTGGVPTLSFIGACTVDSHYATCADTCDCITITNTGR